ncbi:MAG TPA: hypothetical protein VM510_12795, partial [Caulifigura sp.]|nr:hypothetical protein [Caulifigura sp.]
MISISGDRSQHQIIQDFKSQTGHSIRFEIPPSSIPVAWKDVVFWDAVASLEESTHSIAIGDAATRTLVFRPRPPDSAPPIVATTGPCRVEIQGQSLRPNLVDSTRAVMQIRWRLRMEPRLRPLYVTIADRDCSLSDGTATFAPLSPDARREFPIDRWKGAEIDTAFQTPKSVDVGRLKVRLSGQVKVAALPLELNFQDLDQPTPAPRRRGAVTGVVQNVDHNLQLRTLQFDLKVKYDRGGPEFESHRMWIYQNAARLVRKEDSATLAPAEVELKDNAGSGATLA